MPRRCSHCNQDGHNSRTCPNRGVRLFGVRLSDGSMQKSASTGNLAGFARSAAAAAAAAGGIKIVEGPSAADALRSGYASDGFRCGPARERKKGVPWTKHEHKMFLLGLHKLGKGDWRGISRNYVMSRTPTQVASHAQKYFIRHSALNRRKKRVSLFDIVADESATENDAEECGSQPLHNVSNEQSTTDVEADPSIPPPSSNYSYPPPIYPIFFPLPVPQGPKENADVKNDEVEATKSYGFPFVYPTLFSPCFTCPMPYFSSHAAQSSAVLQSHQIVKPMAVHPKMPINITEHFGMSKLNLGQCNGEPKLAGISERQSAFHARASTGGSKLDSSSSPIHAI